MLLLSSSYSLRRTATAEMTYCTYLCTFSFFYFFFSHFKYLKYHACLQYYVLWSFVEPAFNHESKIDSISYLMKTLKLGATCSLVVVGQSSYFPQYLNAPETTFAPWRHRVALNRQQLFYTHNYLYCTFKVHAVIHQHTSEATAVKGELTSGHVELPEEARSQEKIKLLPLFYSFTATLKL